jgi:dihydroneopterin triphosphate diphosphatase
MATIEVNIVDAYVFRRRQGLVQFLLLQRKPDLGLGGTWQAMHGKIDDGETALKAARRTVETLTGATITAAFSADYVNQFFDHQSDALILAPVFAFEIEPSPTFDLSPEYVDFAWCGTEEATARLLFSGQRWAVRHIEEIIGLAGDDAEYYRIR